MLVSQALETRITCRAFSDTPVSAQTIQAILTQASRAPSGGNLQPWHVWGLAGGELARFKALIKDKMAAGQIGDGPTEYQIYPPSLKEPYKARRFKCGEDMYATINVTREDKAGRMANFARNFEFFGAPAALFFAIDRSMQQGQWADLGMFMQSIMLLAREHDLHTAPQEAWAIWHKTIGEFVGIPSDLMLFCGMGIGHMDRSHPINSLRTDRAPLGEFVSLRGF
jgi:nitroreductase